MPLELLGRHPSLALHDIEQGFRLEKQRRLRGFNDGSSPKTELTLTAFADADFWPCCQGIQLLDMTTRAVKFLPLKATVPQQGTGVCFRGDFGKKPFGWKRFVGHQIPPKGTMSWQVLVIPEEIRVCTLLIGIEILVLSSSRSRSFLMASLGDYGRMKSCHMMLNSS